MEKSLLLKGPFSFCLDRTLSGYFEPFFKIIFQGQSLYLDYIPLPGYDKKNHDLIFHL